MPIPPTADKPDVEQIVDAIQANLQLNEAETTPVAPSERTDLNLYDALQRANESYALVLPPEDRSIKSRLRDLVLRLLAPLTARMIEHNENSVQVLNKLVRVMDGRDDDLKGEMLMATRNRMDLIEALSDRIAALEKQVETLQNRRQTEPPS